MQLLPALFAVYRVSDQLPAQGQSRVTPLLYRGRFNSYSRVELFDFISFCLCCLSSNVGREMIVEEDKGREICENIVSFF